MSRLPDWREWWTRHPRARWVVVVLGLVLIGGWLMRPGGTGEWQGATFAARRGPLEITVLESGSIEALEAQEIKCEVRVGYQGTKILRIVEEGYLVTEEDVRQGKVLVELDGSEIEKQLVQQEIQFQNAIANLADAQQNYQIQLNQNLTDLAAAQQKVRFARMDFDKLLGDRVAEAILRQLGLDVLEAAILTNALTIPGSAPGWGLSAPASAAPRHDPARDTVAPASSLEGNASPGEVDQRADPKALPALAQPAGPLEIPPSAQGARRGSPFSHDTSALPTEASLRLPSPHEVDFSRYANLEVLGDGEAKQRLRKLEDDLQVAQKELGQATVTLEGTRRLFEKGFVTRNDLQRDEIAYENARLKVQTAETARALYLKYEFARTAEETLSKYLDAIRELDKTRRQAISRLAQAEARLRSAQAQYEVQRRQREDLQDQLAKCIIRAQKPGLVVYGSGRDEYLYRDEDAIREGATVRERQTIITIPDMSRMAVNVRIHEAYIKKVRKGQKARITVDAFPEIALTGEVTRVAVLPDSQNRWINPDMKVYRTTVTIDGVHGWLKPGMSAKVEILVDRLEDVVYVPVQCVVPAEQGHVCYVARGRRVERRPVQIGEFNDEFIQIREGLREGELVLLRPPATPEGPAGQPAEEREPAPAPVQAAQRSGPPPPPGQS